MKKLKALMDIEPLCSVNVSRGSTMSTIAQVQRCYVNNDWPALQGFW